MCKLQNRSGSAPDAASTSLALWLLEAILSRTHGIAVPTMLDSMLVGPPHASTATVGSVLAAVALTGRDAPKSRVGEVTDFVRTYQELLPYNAVEQILLASGCREDLKEVARLYETWQTVFNLSVTSAPLTQSHCPVFMTQMYLHHGAPELYMFTCLGFPLHSATACARHTIILQCSRLYPNKLCTDMGCPACSCLLHDSMQST